MAQAGMCEQIEKKFALFVVFSKDAGSASLLIRDQFIIDAQSEDHQSTSKLTSSRSVFGVFLT